MSIIKPVDSDYIACAFDPAYLMEHAYDIIPDPWQVDILRSKKKNILMLCSRQSGKSTVCATLAMHAAAFSPNSLVLIVSYINRQAVETFRKVKMGLPTIKKSLSLLADNSFSIEFSNGSRVISLPANPERIRSYAANLIIIDEASWVSDEAYNALRPMLATTKGGIVALSTPFGERGWFHKAWIDDEEYEEQFGWLRIMITADECPRITKEFIENERRIVGDWWVKQEYYCVFVDSKDQLFTHDDIMAALSTEVKAIKVIM